MTTKSTDSIYIFFNGMLSVEGFTRVPLAEKFSSDSHQISEIEARISDVSSLLLEQTFLIALSITLLIEIPLLILTLRVSAKKFRMQLPTSKLIALGALASTCTLPYLWFVLPPFFDGAYYPLQGETIVIIFEAAIYFRLLEISFFLAFLVSSLCNTASYLVGKELLKLL